MKENPLRGHPTTRASEDAELQIPTLTHLARTCPVGPLERQILDEVDGVRTVAELALLLGLGAAEGSALVSRLTQLGAVTVATIDTSVSVSVDVEESES